MIAWESGRSRCVGTQHCGKPYLLACSQHCEMRENSLSSVFASFRLRLFVYCRYEKCLCKGG